jgi:tRNA A37 threonylcarbamoyladenosine biosynthesis protein TsaE
MDRDLISGSPEETERIAAQFYRMLIIGDVVALYGVLGAA